MSGSGGIEVNSPVLVVGNEVGKVTDLRIGHDGGVEAVIRVDDDKAHPGRQRDERENLSALSEPYMIFRPNSAGGPYLRDGQRVDTHESFTPVTIRTPRARPSRCSNSSIPTPSEPGGNPASGPGGHRDRHAAVAAVGAAARTDAHREEPRPQDALDEYPAARR